MIEIKYDVDSLGTVNRVTRIDALGAVANLKVHTALEAGFLLQDRNADIFGHPRVDRGFIYDDRTGDEIAAHNPRSILNREQIRRLILLNGSRDRDDQELAFRKAFLIRSKIDRCIPNGFISHLMGGVYAAFILLNSSFIMVEAKHFHMLGKFHRDRHAHIAKADQCQLLFSRNKAVIQGLDLVAHVSLFSLRILLLAKYVLR